MTSNKSVSSFLLTNFNNSGGDCISYKNKRLHSDLVSFVADMSTSFTIRSKMLLTFMAVWIFLSLAAGGYFKCPSCCDKGTEEVKGEIIKCYEQKQGPECDNNFYIVVIKGDKHFCINPNSQWLKKKREQEGLNCS